ncbi:hypothetical protein BREVNS_0135 [Brevinematales bacterium NS]|nr:hypothetical protein BREVNS_0135 [Brevinematales bacterium NS]
MSPTEEGLPLEREDVFLLARKSGPLSVRGACVACDEDNAPFARAGALRERRKMGNKNSPKLKKKRWSNKYSVFL